MPERGPRNLDLFLDNEPEREKPKNREVVRVFIYKSKGKDRLEAEIDDGVDLSDLQFVTASWCKKGLNAVNPDQIMPVGGKVNEEDYRRGKDSSQPAALVRAVKRELLEETHLRGFDLKRLGNQKYSFQHPREGRINNEVTYFGVRVSPTDVLDPLHPLEDKFDEKEPFVDLDEQQMSNLIADNSLELKPGQKVNLVDSLVIDENLRKEQGKNIEIQADDKEILTVFWELGKQWSDLEVAKKKDVMQKAIQARKNRGESVGLEDEEGFLRQVESEDDYYKIQSLYGEFIKKAGITKQELLDAIFLSNLAEEFEHLGTSRCEVLLRFMATFFVSKNWKNEYFAIATEKNPQYMGPFLEQLRTLVVRLSEIGGVDVQQIDEFYEQLLAFKRDSDLEDDVEVDEEKYSPARVSEIFKEVFGLDNEPRELGEFVNNFLNNLAKESILPMVKGNFGVEEVFQYSEVARANMSDLFKMSIYDPEDEWMKQRFKTKESRRKALFQARRKLVLMLLADPVVAYYNEVVQANSESNPIHDIWMGGEVMSGPEERGEDSPHNYFLHRVYKNEGGKQVLDNVAVVTESMGESDKPLFLRRVDLSSGSCLVENIDDNVKTIESVFRKVLVRGFDEPSEIRDIYRRTLVVHPIPGNVQSEKMLEMSSVEVSDNISMDKNSRPDDQEAKFVLELMEKLVEVGRQNGEEIRITDYRPSTTGSDKGPGSETKGLHFAKFYIECIGRDGVVRNEEVQIFIAPPQNEKTAFYFHERKLEDDLRYSAERMTDTKGTRSVLELLRPKSVYKSTREVYKKK